MPKTVGEYIEQTKALIDHGEISESITPTSAILDTFHSSSMVGSFYIFLPDFGHVVCWCRYSLLPDEFNPDSPYHEGYTKEEVGQRRAAAEAGFEQLLEQFVQQGYQPEMGERLLQIGNDNFFECELAGIYVLPGDLDAVLTIVGNPLMDADDEEDDEDENNITAAAIGFDLNNPEHRQKLAERLVEAGL